METTLKKKATKQDYMNLPEGAPYQLINGELIMSPAPKFNHQNIILEISFLIKNFLNNNHIGVLVISPMDVHFDEENIFQPDILFISKENKNCRIEDWVYGPPDLIIEVLSEFNSYFDTKKKFRVYENYGVKEYFIVDPNDKEVHAFKNENNQFKEVYKEVAMIRSEILQGETRF
jgi:Uma2 family endonuclease